MSDFKPSMKAQAEYSFGSRARFNQELDKYLNQKIGDNKKKIMEITKYCEPHKGQMWAATILRIIKDCDFRDV